MTSTPAIGTQTKTYQEQKEIVSTKNTEVIKKSYQELSKTVLEIGDQAVNKAKVNYENRPLFQKK